MTKIWSEVRYLGKHHLATRYATSTAGEQLLRLLSPCANYQVLIVNPDSLLGALCNATEPDLVLS